jgi:chromosome segregation ATPase
MSDRQGGETEAMEELLRVNAELAAELRALSQGRTTAPRPGPHTAARRLPRLEAEVVALAAELEATAGKLEETQAHREGLERQNQQMAAEIARLSARLDAGLLGHLRRLRHRVAQR